MSTTFKVVSSEVVGCAYVRGRAHGAHGITPGSDSEAVCIVSRCRSRSTEARVVSLCGVVLSRSVSSGSAFSHACVVVIACLVRSLRCGLLSVVAGFGGRVCMAIAASEASIMDEVITDTNFSPASLMARLVGSGVSWVWWLLLFSGFRSFIVFP